MIDEHPGYLRLERELNMKGASGMSLDEIIKSEVVQTSSSVSLNKVNWCIDEFEP